MANRMPPPGAAQPHGMAVIISVGKPAAGKSDGKMPPPGMKMPDEETPRDDAAPDEPGKKASPEDAQVVREDSHCSDCKNYHPDTGECDKVDSMFAPNDGCVKFFEAMEDEGEEEPDADDMGGPPDGDIDDEGEAQA